MFAPAQSRGRTAVASLLVPLFATVLGACDTPCSALEEHALGCGASTPRYVDERDSACVDTRREVGAESFDEFANCVTSSSCEDGPAIQRCIGSSFDPRVADDPCSQFKLWVSACGLEPVVDVGEDCGGVSTGLAGVTFESYVECLSADGCPGPNDPRWIDCQNIVPQDVNELLEACELVNQWTVRCEGQALSAFPVDIITLPECLAEAQFFTVSSHTTYAECIDELECPNIPGRLDCITMLSFIDDDTAELLCPQLVAFGETCGASLGGGTVQACITGFGRFTPESFTTYVGCITARPCGDPAAPLECGQVLDLQ